MTRNIIALILFGGLSLILGVLGLSGLIYFPVSDCVQLTQAGSMVAPLALLGLAGVIWLLPIRQVLAWRAITAAFVLLLAGLAFYFPSALDEHRRDVISCTKAQHNL